MSVRLGGVFKPNSMCEVRGFCLETERQFMLTGCEATSDAHAVAIQRHPDIAFDFGRPDRLCPCG